MRFQFLILLLIPILLIPTISAQSLTELEILAGQYNLLKEQYDTVNLNFLHQKTVIDNLYAQKDEINKINTQLARLLSTSQDKISDLNLDLISANDNIKDLKVMIVENKVKHKAEIRQLQTELNNTKIIVIQQKDEVVQEEQILDEFKELYDPKIIKQKIKLHNELMSLEPEWIKVKKAYHNDQEKANHAKYPDEPIREFGSNFHNPSFPALGEYSIPISRYEQYIESTKYSIEHIKKEHKEWKEYQELELQEEKLELQKQQELDKISELKDSITSNLKEHHWLGYKIIHDDYEFIMSRGMNNNEGVDKHNIHFTLHFPDYANNIVAPKNGDGRPDVAGKVIVKNSDGDIFLTEDHKGSLNQGELDTNKLPYGIYKYEIDYKYDDNNAYKRDNGSIRSGYFEHEFYYFYWGDDTLTNAEKITHLQKQLDFVKNYLPKESQPSK